MTSQERRLQRELVLRSMLLAETPEDRHGDYRRRSQKKAHAYAVPVVRELRRLV